MKWSKFNHLYFSERHNKHLLYNAISNAFIDVDNPDLLLLFNSMREKNIIEENASFANLYNELQRNKILVESDEIEIMKIKHYVLARRYSNTTINLTILPTLSCNFECPYCFVNEGKGNYMDNITMDKILKFVDYLAFNTKEYLLHIAWMGGEPLLNFRKIKEITTTLQKKISNISSIIVTNGYLLSKDKIQQLEALNVKQIQVTIDGLDEQHNATRIHKKHRVSFNKIVANLDCFFDLYKNNNNLSLNLRVNISKNEDYIKKFLTVYKFFRLRYPYSNLHVSPGFIENIKSNGHNMDFEFTRSEKENLFDTIIKLGGLEYSSYPNNSISECAVRSPSTFVIGPVGELYSCWENIGFKEYEIGYLNEMGRPIITNELLYFRYLTAADHIFDEECVNCFFFPTCEGGCPEKRIRNQHCSACFDVCIFHKNDIENMLDLHYTLKNNLKNAQ